MSVRQIMGVPFIQVGNAYIALNNIKLIKFKDGGLLSSPCIKIRILDEDFAYTYNDKTDEYKSLKAFFDNYKEDNNSVLSVESTQTYKENRNNDFPNYSSTTKRKQ